jgi:hypothetical protein
LRNDFPAAGVAFPDTGNRSTAIRTEIEVAQEIRHAFDAGRDRSRSPALVVPPIQWPSIVMLIIVVMIIMLIVAAATVFPTAKVKEILKKIHTASSNI